MVKTHNRLISKLASTQHWQSQILRLAARSRRALAVFIFLAFAPVAVAANPSGSDPFVDGNLSVLRCAEKGGMDFGAFLNAMIYNDSLKEGIIEPWSDILYRNQCQANDVIALVKQQDKVRKAIRDAFMTCNTSKIPRLKSRYYSLTAEIYYVRHVVDGGLILSLPFDILDSRFTDAVRKSDTKLYQEMKNRYAGETMIKSKDFDGFFSGLQSKYRERIPSYINECHQGNWQDVANKWKEFVDDWGGTKGALEKAGKNISARAGALAKDVKTMEVAKLLNNEESFASYVGSFFDLNINGLPPKQALSDIAQALSNSLPTGKLPTQESLLSKLSNASEAFDFDKTEKELRSKFSVLYLNSSDEKIQEIISYLDGRSSKGIDGTIENIEGSFPQLGEILSLTKTMNNRQCSGQ